MIELDSSGGGWVEQSMRSKLTEAFAPQRLRIRNDSPEHTGHAGAGEGVAGETHFSVSLVSEQFEGVSLLQRNRAVHHALAQELRSCIHALSLDLATPKEFGRR